MRKVKLANSKDLMLGLFLYPIRDIVPTIGAPIRYPSKYPKVGFKTYAKPPPAVKIGIPINPIAIYKPIHIVPCFAPNNSIANKHIVNCKAIGTGGKGILINAPIIINAKNNAFNAIV